uniref:C2H2-type domain-containing protein n=1 Tax=Mesocestoides corti TaxID=53468 RepID=A0A5K3F5K0_MESCO
MTSSQFCNVQHDYVAHFYNLFEAFIGVSPCASHRQAEKPVPPIHSSMSSWGSAATDGTWKGMVECQLCGGAFPTPVHLAHHSCPHMTRTAFECKNCHKAFSCSANLASHQRWHKPTNASRKLQKHQFNHFSLACKRNAFVCSNPKIGVSVGTPKASSFSIESILQMDINAHKPETSQYGPNFACFLCGSKFFSPRDFEDHLIDHLLRGDGK